MGKHNKNKNKHKKSTYGFTLQNLYWLKKWMLEHYRDAHFIANESNYKDSSRRYQKEAYNQAVEQLETIKSLRLFFSAIEDKLKAEI